MFGSLACGTSHFSSKLLHSCQYPDYPATRVTTAEAQSRPSPTLCLCLRRLPVCLRRLPACRCRDSGRRGAPPARLDNPAAVVRHGLVHVLEHVHVLENTVTESPP